MDLQDQNSDTKEIEIEEEENSLDCDERLQK